MGMTPMTARNLSGYLAAAWALAYGVIALVWTVTGDGYPFGSRNDDQTHPLRAVPVDVGAPVFAVVLLGAAVLALALAGRQPLRPPPTVRAVLLGTGWTLVAALVFLVPGAHILAIAGYTPMLLIGAPFGWPDQIDYGVIFNWTTAAELAALIGGLLLGRALLTWQAVTPVVARGPVRLGPWVTYVAAAVPAFYGLTRLAWAVGIPLGVEPATLDEPDIALAATGLGGFALVGTVLTIGLLRPWGARFPRWLPGLGGRPVPVRLATVPAAAVALAVGAASASFLTDTEALHLIAAGDLAVLPMAFWPLWTVTLLLAAYAYHRRRTASPVVLTRTTESAVTGLVAVPTDGQAATGSAAGIEARIASSTSVADRPKVAAVKVESSTKGRSH
ncbi:hypothetical protein Asi02nite_30140 [Asanoa siamensis]|uniref:Uncharacterized protein n=1 Tax=Asanoa siamensis TaxID=926357 RepID=A0ABQ4CQB7_9ACTN|nr:hypothetical protein Asi02nite_30140 [Asanoa siamensis]